MSKRRDKIPARMAIYEQIYRCKWCGREYKPAMWFSDGNPDPYCKLCLNERMAHEAAKLPPMRAVLRGRYFHFEPIEPDTDDASPPAAGSRAG